LIYVNVVALVDPSIDSQGMPAGGNSACCTEIASSSSWSRRR